MLLLFDIVLILVLFFQFFIMTKNMLVRLKMLILQRWVVEPDINDEPATEELDTLVSFSKGMHSYCYYA